MRLFCLQIMCLLLLTSIKVQAQIEKVFVENYYLSDSIDATDMTGGVLEIGSKTYRIYIDLKPGTKIKKIYGDAFHPIIIKSTENFYNHATDGQTFGKDFSKNRLGESTVALDTWLTIGQATKSSTSNTYFGLPKIYDMDGSVIGGINNDGGSEAIAEGLLTNNSSFAGIPLITSDGLDTMLSLPDGWGSYGIVDFNTAEDSTIFGSLVQGNEFISYDAGLQNSGTSGVVPDSNQVLVAQLTTKGDLTFELNIEVEEIDGVFTKIVKYVANADTLFDGEVVCPFLKFPLECGCTDPNYLEYSDNYGCNNQDSCKNKIIFGCLDTLACNYDPKANFNLKSLCCYPGYCNDRDLSLVCPELRTGTFEFFLYPNPADDIINLNFTLSEVYLIKYAVYNSFGTEVIAERALGSLNGTNLEQINVSSLIAGSYIFKLNVGNNLFKKMFTKK